MTMSAATDAARSGRQTVAARPVSFGISKPICALIALSYATVLASLPLMAFMDRENYLNYARYAPDIFEAVANISMLAAMANEPLWLGLNIGLSRFMSPEATIRTIIFVPAFLVAYLMLRAGPRNWLLIIAFLLLPQILKNHITHLRQGVGLAVFLLGWFSSGVWRRRILMTMAAFIHASFFFVIVLHAATHVMQRLRLAADIRGIAFGGFGVAIGIGLGMIAALIGARQANVYEFSSEDISGLGFLFWSGMLVLYVLEGRAFLARHGLVFAAMLFYLGTYFFIEVTARIFESVLPLVLLAGLDLRGERRALFLAVFALFSILQWTVMLTRSGPAF